MARFSRPLLPAGFLVCSSLLAHTLAAEPQPKAGDDAAELKAAQQERIKVLDQAVQILTSQYQVGTAEFGQLRAAETEYYAAQLDSTDDPKERIVLLTKQLDRAGELQKVIEARFNAGTVGQTDFLRAKSFYLESKIKLLRERGRTKTADLKQQGGLPSRPQAMRRLDGLQVDGHGIIWKDGKPVGVWGVDGPEVSSR
jgi:hypothetical protein